MSKIAVVTGGSRGIGYAIAARLAQDGWNLVVSARNVDRLADAAYGLRQCGSPRVSHFAADMSKEDQVDALAESVLAAKEPVDLLVLSAGIGSAGQIEGFPMRKFDLLYSVNVRAPFHLMSRLLPLLRDAAAQNGELGARIVALSSITGHAAEPGLAAYGATKAALSSLCETLTAEEGNAGVIATALSPGYVDTEMAAWTHGTVPPENMIKGADLAEVVSALTRMSRYAAVPSLVVTRPGPNLYRA